jgi:putative ABC transport system permease protein
MWIDEGYQTTFGLTLAAGRNFNQKEPGATCLINESAAHALGYPNAADAVNNTIITGDQKMITVVGVLKDYHHESVRKAIDPIVFFHRHPNEYGYYSFQVHSRQGDYLQTLQKIWARHYPNDQFIYYFMDHFFEEQYQADELFSTMLRLFSIISITVASLGLFGMASLAMVKRTKEIGVRKVLGASVGNIVLMLSKSYIKMIGISCLFAFPLCFYLTHRWLQGFAYQITVRWWMIVMPGVIVLIATLLTVASQSIRAAIVNPAKSLRDQ